MESQEIIWYLQLRQLVKNSVNCQQFEHDSCHHDKTGRRREHKHAEYDSIMKVLLGTMVVVVFSKTLSIINFPSGNLVIKAKENSVWQERLSASIWGQRTQLSQ
jgi:hypothetical protein